MASRELLEAFAPLCRLVSRSSSRRSAAVLRLVNKWCLGAYDKYAVQEEQGLVRRFAIVSPLPEEVVELQTLRGYRQALAKVYGYVLFCVRHGLLSEVSKSLDVNLGVPEEANKTLQVFLMSTVIHAWLSMFVRDHPRELFDVLGQDAPRVICLLILAMRNSFYIPLDDLKASRVLVVCGAHPNMSTEILDWIVEMSHGSMTRNTRSQMFRVARRLPGGQQWIHVNRRLLN
jgi:hypothetical protein